jgi:hypothetical protein
MRKRMSENTTAGAAADRAAIERWEGEGGRTLALEEPLIARPGALSRSGAPEENSISTRQTRPTVNAPRGRRRERGRAD